MTSRALTGAQKKKKNNAMLSRQYSAADDAMASETRSSSGGGGGGVAAEDARVRRIEAVRAMVGVRWRSCRVRMRRRVVRRGARARVGMGIFVWWVVL